MYLLKIKAMKMIDETKMLEQIVIESARNET